MAAMAINNNNNEEKMDSLSRNSIVEVRINRYMLKGAWYLAKILELNPNDTIQVQYQSNPPITDCVHISSIGPLPPPPPPDQTYKKHDIVDAFRRNGWWKGVVTEVSEEKSDSRRYTVVFTNPKEKFEFFSANLRFHLVWSDDGRWVHPHEQFEQSIYLDTRSRSKKQQIPTPEIDETLPNDSNKFTKENSSNPLSPDECCAASTPMNTSVLPNRTRCEEQSAHVSFKGLSAVDNESALEKSKKNPLEYSTPPSTTSTSKKLKMLVPKTEETLPNYSNNLRTEYCANILSSPDECGVTLMPMNSTEEVANSATTNCSTIDTSGDGMAESSEKRETELNTQVTGQQVPAAVNGEAEREPVRNKDPPFKKSSYMWNLFDSLEVFRVLPQKPHFSSLLDCHEETREGSAIGHMLTFASLVEKVTKLQINDPRSLFDSYLEALNIVEAIGFDVKAVVDRVNELLILITRKEQLDNRLKRYQSLVAKCDEKKAKMEQEFSVIDKTMSELADLRALKMSEMLKEDSSREFLQLQVSIIKDAMFYVEHEFKVKATSPWHIL